MKILYHHRTQGKGVEGVHIHELVKALKAHGHLVDIIAPPGVSTEGKNHKLFNGLKRKIYRLITGFLPEFIFELFELAYNMQAGRQLSRCFQQRKYGMVYERYAIFNWAGIRRAHSYGVPIILEVNYTAQTPLFRKRSRLLKPLACLIDKYLFREADGIVVVSSYLREHLKKVYAVPEEKIIVLPNAADPQRFSPAIESGAIRRQLGLENKLVFGFVGGFYPWHGLDLFCSAITSIAGSRSDITVLLIGDGPQRPIIKNLVLKQGLGDRIIFHDKVAHHDLPKYLAAFDVAVMPDSNEYGSPMKIFEYMAMGIPVVAPELEPIMDAIKDGVEGLLFKPKDSQSMAEALKQLAENEPLRRAMGRAGRERILSRHNWIANARAIIQLHEKFNRKAPKPRRVSTAKIVS